MFRKSILVISFLIIIGLLTSGIAAAKPLSTWTKVLDPADFGFPPIDFTNYPDITGGYATTALEPFDGALFAYVGGWSGARMLKTNDGTTWEVLTDFGLGIDETLTGGWDMQAFDHYLYVVAGSLFSDLPKMVLRSPDGASWEVVHAFEPGTGDVDKLGVFNEMIYVTTVYPGTIWRSPSGDPGTWEKVADLGENVGSAASPKVFKGWFYILFSEGPLTGTMTLMRTNNGVDWERVDSDVLYADPLDYDLSLEVHEGALYLSTGSYTCDENWVVCENLGGKIFRSRNGLDWEQVVDDGFGIPDNFEIVLYAFQGYLYAITNNDGMNSGNPGAQVWRSPNGDAGTWEMINEPGWGDPDNNWTSIRGAQAGFKSELYIAGWSFTAPVWKLER